MASPTIGAILQMSGQIQGHITGGFAANSDNYIVGKLNALSYSGNPSPQGSSYKTYVSSDLLVLTPTGLLNTFMYIPGFNDMVIPALDTNPKTDALFVPVINWYYRCYLSNIITSQIYLGASGYLTAKIPDPTWPSSVSWATLNIHRDVDYNDMTITRAYVGIQNTGTGP